MKSAPDPPQYVILQEKNQHGITVPPPPYYQPTPHYNLHNHRKRSGGHFCFRFICGCYCCLFLLVVILTILAFYSYTVYKPKIPSYSIDTLQVKSLDIKPDFTLNTEFQITVKADNPNRNIGFIYGNESYVEIIYSGTNIICSGNIPSFHQGHQNTTFIKVDMKGKSDLGSGLQQGFMENQRDNRIPLLVRVKIPVRVVVGKFPLRQFKVFVNCDLVVDNLALHKKIAIVSRKTTFDFQF